MRFSPYPPFRRRIAVAPCCASAHVESLAIAVQLLRREKRRSRRMLNVNATALAKRTHGTQGSVQFLR